VLDGRQRALRVADAARNNAAWCDAVCAAHGRAGELRDGHWLCRAPVPPFHPNLVTFDAAPAPALAAVRELEAALPPASWGVKDSFAALSLEPAGFRVLFEAEWILRPAPAPRRPPRARWIRVESEDALAAWEEAWSESAGAGRIFLPALLRRSDVAFLAALGAGGKIAAGIVANRSGSAVGLSNFFAREERAALREEGADAARDAFPGLPQVGYESGADLAEARAAGFDSLGPLRVWQRETLPRDRGGAW
jgi:hypothetical protein